MTTARGPGDIQEGDHAAPAQTLRLEEGNPMTGMTGKLSFAVLFALFTGAAFAAGPQTAVAYTFVCKGSPLLAVGPCANGASPNSLIQGADGNFYGAAEASIESPPDPEGGTVFSLTSNGTFTLLHTFAAGANQTYPDGNLPSVLTQGPDGKLYGETRVGGVGSCTIYPGCGVLYRLNTDGSGFQIIHKFCSQANCADGWAGGVLVAGTDGNLYATSYAGGTGTCSVYVYKGCGTIFRVTPSTGAYRVVFNFSSSTSGGSPSNLIAAPDGTFYGLSNGTPGELLFHYTPATGTVTTAVLNFPLFDGDLPSAPTSGLTLGPNGNLYGLYEIYAESGKGLFEVEPDGSNLQFFPFYTTFESGGEPDGLVLATDGNFWIAESNGSNGYGNIVTVSPIDGTLLQTFSPFVKGGSLGGLPVEIIQAKDGTFWGSTDFYGDAPEGYFADGTVFSLNAGLPPR